MEIKVDLEFQRLLPALTKDEKNGLEKSLKKEGCREALIAWDGILLDGYTRYEICQRLDIPFKIHNRTFDNRNQAKLWIINNQDSRRNITPEQRTYLLGIQYELEKKEVGARGPEKMDQKEPSFSTAEKIAEQHHVSPATVKRAEKFAEAVDKLSPEEKTEVLAGKSPKTKAEIINPKKKEKREYKLLENPTGCNTVSCLDELIEKGLKFSTVYADPPWSYSNQSTRSAAGKEYPTLTIKELSELPIPALITEDAHLHLWVTSSFLHEGLHLMESWGFKYKSSFVWVKTQMGIGNYWRLSHEFLLFGVKGENGTFKNHALKSWVEAKRTQHSAKPEIIRNFIELASPPEYLELFGRMPVKGWTVFGNQIERNMFDGVEETASVV